MVTFKAVKNLGTGFKITENGTEKDLVFGGLVYTEESFMINDVEVNTEDHKIAYQIPIKDLDSIRDVLKEAYPGYHVCTYNEMNAVKELLCTYRGDAARSILTWKDPEDIPEGLTGPEYLEKYVGLDFKVSMVQTDGSVKEFDHANIVILDNEDPIHRWAHINKNSGVILAFSFPSDMEVHSQILLVKDRE